MKFFVILKKTGLMTELWGISFSVSEKNSPNSNLTRPMIEEMFYPIKHSAISACIMEFNEDILP